MQLNGRRRSISQVAIDCPVTVIHGSNEGLLPAPLILAPSSTLGVSVRLSMTVIAVLAGKPVLIGLGFCGRLGRMRLAIFVGRPFILPVCISLTSAAPSTMTLPL
jgi:hypothetical protein